MRSFTVSAVGPFSLAASIGFLEEFTPSGFTRGAQDQLDLAFAADRDWHPVGVQLEQRKSAINGQFWGKADSEHVRTQIQRILSLDVDATPFTEVGQRDPVVGRLQAHYRGLRPVCFWSPYEAACWAIIGHRIRITQAAAIKTRMARELGDEVRVGTRSLFCFPAPARLARLEGFPGLSGRKPEWLRGVAEHALDGDLDAFLLRDLPQQEALAHLKKIPGIGDFSAELILIRGAGDPDFAPHHEPRFARAVAVAYGLPQIPTQEELDQITDGWRPFRSWVSFLMRRNLGQ